MAETATQRIARELAARKNAAPQEDEAPAAENDEAPAADEDDDSIIEAPAKPMTMKEKQAARKAAAAAQPVAEDEEDETSEPEESNESAPSAKTSSAKPKPSASSSSKAKPSASGKKPASPAQIAAREKFAAASRARAAERAGISPSVATASKASTAKRASKPTSSPKVLVAKAVVSKGRQTPEQVKAAQSEDRKAAREAAAEAAAPRRNQPTGKPKTVKETAAAKKARTKREVAEAAPKLTVSKGVKQGPKAQSSRTTTPREAGETRTKVHALLAKGKTRREIMEALDLSYPSVLYHARSFEGQVASTRGSVFVKTNLDEEGNKLGKGKTEEVSRSEAMRRDFLSGMKIGDVARKHEVRYQIAYTAIRPLILAQEEE